ncbi:glycosyltransferase family 2 protein [uncultured Tenacibaculum sp.]|uniref:glycosyltransferase family 2 protein n=1 Tax=uncultured Tenacibaculum sp. TaxID=174713 RepID=UPI0026203F5A|nr:glycosyltransferase family 2 protein [uncultured Tenacibaculum sp.]
MVTIAIPFYNAENFLEDAIKSVIVQTYSNWTLLLIDDGSKDSSLRIAKKYEELDSRIKVHSDGENKNLGYRLNEIPYLVKTKYLARMDADDIMHPERIETQVEVLEKYEDIDVLGTNAYSINEKNIVEGIKIKLDSNRPMLVKCDSFIHPTIMAKREWFENNPYDVKALRIEDAELWRRTRAESRFMVYTRPLLYYREFGNSYYRKYFKSLKGAFYIFKKEFKSIKKVDYFFNGFLKTLFMGIIFYLYNLVNREDVLLKKRYTKEGKIEVIDFI